MSNLINLINSIGQQVKNIKNIIFLIEEQIQTYKEQNNFQESLEIRQNDNNNSYTSKDNTYEKNKPLNSFNSIPIIKEESKESKPFQKHKLLIQDQIKRKENENDEEAKKSNLKNKFSNSNNVRHTSSKVKLQKPRLKQSPKEFLESLKHLNFDPVNFPFINYVKRGKHQNHNFAKKINSINICKWIPTHLKEQKEKNEQILKNIYLKYAHALDLDTKLLQDVYLRLNIN